MNLHLGKKLEAIREKINNDKHYQGALHNLRADIDKAWQQADEGKTVDFNVDEMMQELDAQCPAIK